MVVPLVSSVAARIPYVVSALSKEWRRPSEESTQGIGAAASLDTPRVQVFLPQGCTLPSLQALICRLTVGGDGADLGLAVSWQPRDLPAVLQLVQVASMLQIEELIPELVNLVREAVLVGGDLSALQEACDHLELPAALREAACDARCGPREPAGLPDEKQVRGMIASALLTADGKVWRVVQKVIDRREVWPRLAKENATILLDFATGGHSSIRATPHTGFFWGSRDFLYLVCRYIRSRPQHFDAMVSAMFDSVYTMDPELPAEVIDAVFKELLVHDGLTFAQCEHAIAKLMQRVDQLEYLFHEWSGVFPLLPRNARQALAKGLLPKVGRCPHSALDFVLQELESAPPTMSTGLRAGCCRQRKGSRLHWGAGLSVAAAGVVSFLHLNLRGYY